MYRRQSIEQAHEDLEEIFRRILPRYRMGVREEQIRLSHAMLDALCQQRVALCDAGVGIGKTYAYLAACAVWKKYSGFQSYYCSGGQPSVAISTSSITLQDALTKEYIPFLSNILLTHKMIQEPLRSVVRKGKERFVCDNRLDLRLRAVEHKKKNSEQRKALLSLQEHFDMDKVHGLSGFDRRQVCVPKSCPKDCLLQETCRYQNYLKQALSPDVFIQICNHNYLLADAIHRHDGYKPLLKNYEALIVDEAHKLPEAARQMYGERLTGADLAELCRLLEKEQYTNLARKLREAFQVVMDSVYNLAMKEDHVKVSFHLDSQRKRALLQASRLLTRVLHTVDGNIPSWICRRLERSRQILDLFLTGETKSILYLEYDLSGSPAFCSNVQGNEKRLGEQLWKPGLPSILTSGTLMAGDGFERTRQLMGLTNAARVSECVAVSPFCYKENCLLYFPKKRRTVRPEGGNEVRMLAEQVYQLICATHGHTLVLFTSYTLMGNIYQELKHRVPYPLLKVWKNSQEVIREFKEQKNSVLFAAGSCWEGVDFPGDSVSSLIIVRLPFAVPDPISEAERENYDSLHQYIRKIVVPDMQRRLRQGFGRAIRTETDTCVVSILDNRAGIGGRYHQDVLDALPECMVTDRMVDVENFIQRRKGILYYI